MLNLYDPELAMHELIKLLQKFVQIAMIKKQRKNKCTPRLLWTTNRIIKSCNTKEILNKTWKKYALYDNLKQKHKKYILVKYLIE